TLRNEGCILTMITVCFLPFLRKAISRSGLHYLGPPQPSLPPCVLTLLAFVSFAVCCVWILCVLLCPLYSLFKKSAPRRKCAACKIVVHTGCMEQLEKAGCTDTSVIPPVSHFLLSLQLIF
uniref:Phorbol-ester/DAG-type domain-containing protein n=1 Tax=Maylandia zebra TaxID=106582 RepID=A0A3P9AUM8_9CICH